jgi:hypothetical protein
MPWLLPPQGRTDSELLASGTGQMTQGGHYTIGRNQFADAIANIAPGVLALLKKKRNDEIVNAMMNQFQPPRAEAVDQYGATYDPALAARQGLTGPEPVATKPFTGGVQGFEVAQMFREMQQRDEDRKWKLEDRQYQHEARKPDTVMNDLDYQIKYRQAHPEEFPKQNDAMTTFQRESLRIRQERENRLTDKQPKGTDIISKSGLSVQDLDTPNLVKYYRMEGEHQIPVSGEEASKYPGEVFAQPPGSKQFIPLEQWQAAASSFRQKHQPKVMGQQTDASKAPTVNKTPVQVSTPAEANALEPGTYYLDPQGKLHQR